MKLIIDSDEVSKVCQNGSEFYLEPEAEKSLARLLDIQQQINEFVEKVKENIETNATSIDPNFTGLKGDLVKIEYHETGARYAIEQPEIVEQAFITTKTTQSLNLKAVERYELENGSLPLGVERLHRAKKLIIKRVGQ